MSRQRKCVSAGQQNKIVKFYNQGYGLKDLGEHFGHCVAVIRRVLVDNGVGIRSIGRPHIEE